MRNNNSNDPNVIQEQEGQVIEAQGNNEQAHNNLFALQEELDALYAQLREYEGINLNRAEARIAEIERILYRAGQPHNASENQSEDPKEGSEENPGLIGGRRRKTRKAKKAKKTRKARKASKKTRRTRHKKYTKRR